MNTTRQLVKEVIYGTSSVNGMNHRRVCVYLRTETANNAKHCHDKLLHM